MASPYQNLAQLGDGEEYELRGDTERLYDVASDMKIVIWRESNFLKLGFSAFQARTMAIRRDVDREEVERMVKAGAPCSAVVSIVL